jgi:hypothetical protein
MDKPASARKLKRNLLILFAALFAAFLLYALSIGPATLLNQRGLITVQTLEKIYLPLSLVTDLIPGSTDLIDSYLRLWVDPGN